MFLGSFHNYYKSIHARTNSSSVVLIISILVILSGFVIVPFIYIWALNTLIPGLNIQYSLETWVAIHILGAKLA